MTDPAGESVPELRVEITPSPTDDERDALVAALAVAVAVRSTQTVANEQSPVELPPARWARAGREAAFAARDLRTRRSRWR
jgi:hypothetical protein